MLFLGYKDMLDFENRVILIDNFVLVFFFKLV